MGPHKLTAHIHKRGLDVGIAGASVHAIRRASADKFAVSMGKDKTLFVLNHGDRLGKTFDEHYSTGLQHIPLVDIMLDEYAGKLSPLELKTLRNKALASPAVNALVRRSKMSEEGVTTARSRYRQTKEEIEQIQNHPRYARLTEECTVAWNQVIDLYPSVSSPYSTQSGKALPRIMKNPTTYPEAVVQARVNHFKALNAQSGKLRRKLLSKLRYQTAMEVAKESWKGVTAEERDKAAEDLEKSNPVLDEIANAHQQEVSNYLRSKRQPTALRVSKVDAMSMELPEEIRQELEGAPDSAEEESDEESDDNPEEDDDNITLAAGLPINPPAITPTVPAPAPNRISQLNISLDRPPAIAPDIPDVEDQLDNEPPFDDSKEPDALGLPVDVARKLYMRLLYRPLLLQRERALDKGKGKSQFICRECLRFPTRVKDPKIVEAGGMVFKTSSALGRHMQEQHDAWSNLELEMVSGKPGMLKCPECPFEVTSKITMFRHLRTSCPSKDKFIPLYEARQSFRPSEQMNEAARQDRRREAKLVSTTILPEDDTIEIAEDVKKRLAQPGMLKRWAEQVGYNQSKFGEHTAEEIQAHLHTLFDAAIQHASGSGPEPVEALPQNCMDRTLEDTIKLVTEGPYAEDLEDYDDGDADDGNNAGLGD
ncbi:hypothetical protein FS749_015320 [Ceratobasidium sp. UAMH 11750]|nr:hypothetical protein FS749_015320 [Ceratobasidium sp. UAMH 11750]